MRNKKFNRKFSIAAAVAAIFCAETSYAIDYTITDVDNINIVANDDSSANNEGVHILSNWSGNSPDDLTSTDTQAAAEIHVMTDGTISAYSSEMTLGSGNDVKIFVNDDGGSAGNFVVIDGATSGVGGTEFISGDSDTLTLSSTTTSVTSSTLNITGTISDSSGNVTVGDSLDVTGDLSVTGAISSASGTITTLNSTTGNVTTLNSTTGNVTTLNSTTANVSGTLNLTGALSDNTGNVTINDALDISGATALSSSLSVSGATTLSSSLDVQGAITNTSSNNGGAVYINDALTVTGASTTSGITNTGAFSQTGTANINTSGTADTSIGNTTGTVSITGASVGINSSGGSGTVSIGSAAAGDITLQSSANSTLVVGDNGTSVTGALSATGNTTLGSDANTTNIIGNAGTSTNTLTGATNNITATTANNISGTTYINTSADNATTIGASENTSAVSIYSGASTIQAADGTTTISGTTNNISGDTNINTHINSATNINTGTSTGPVTIGAQNNQTNLNSSVNNIGTSNLYSTTNNIGVDAAFASYNTIGNTNSNSSAALYGGNSNVTVINGQASISSGSSGYTAYSTPQTVGTDYALINGNTASQALVTGTSVNNIISGNTLVDGNMFINGTLVYSSNTSATTSVIDQTRDTSSAMTIVNNGEQGAVVDGNGKIGFGTAQGTTAALTVTNQLGNTHGVVVNESQTTISGGTRSTSMTLNDNGATFSNSATGRPVQVHGVADGSSDFDAVNYRQLRSVKRGLASTTAMANIPMVDVGKRFSIGVGFGGYDGENAAALGISARPTDNVAVRASVGTSFSSGSSSDNTTWGVGGSYSW